jgi:hypothetical protein
VSGGGSRARRSRGQALVEFAIVAPVFFLLIFGVIEAGRFIFYYHTLNHATRKGARYAIIHGSNALDGCPSGPPAVNSTACDVDGDNVRAAVEKAAFGLAGSGTLVIPDPVYYGPNGANNGRGSNVTVSVSYTYVPIIPVMPNISISAESTLVVNN